MPPFSFGFLIKKNRNLNSFYKIIWKINLTCKLVAMGIFRNMDSVMEIISITLLVVVTLGGVLVRG